MLENCAGVPCSLVGVALLFSGALEMAGRLIVAVALSLRQGRVEDRAEPVSQK